MVSPQNCNSHICNKKKAGHSQNECLFCEYTRKLKSQDKHCETWEMCYVHVKMARDSEGSQAFCWTTFLMLDHPHFPGTLSVSSPPWHWTKKGKWESLRICWMMGSRNPGNKHLPPQNHTLYSNSIVVNLEFGSLFSWQRANRSYKGKYTRAIKQLYLILFYHMPSALRAPIWPAIQTATPFTLAFSNVPPPTSPPWL